MPSRGYQKPLRRHRRWWCTPPARANLAELYRRRVAELEQLLVDPELGSGAMDLIRSMITEITVTPREEGDGVDLDLAGDLAGILHLWQHEQHAKRPGRWRRWACWCLCV